MRRKQPIPAALRLQVIDRDNGRCRACGIGDRDALQAIATAFKHLKIIIEPGGAAAVAAVLTGQFPQGATTVVAVASGGNIDAQMFRRALDEGPLF